jgi:hypothetical protein
VHAAATHAEAMANELAADYVLSNINFYVHEGAEKVAMLFVKKAPVAGGIMPGARISR